MNNMEAITPQTIDIKKMKSMIPPGYASFFGDDFIITDINFRADDAPILQFPVRFDGFLVMFCVQGNFVVDLNLRSYEIKENTLLVYIPGYIVRLDPVSKSKDLHIVLVAISRDYLSSLSFDIVQLFKQSMKIMNDPCITLDGSEFDVCRKYFELALEVTTHVIERKKDALGSLVSSFCFTLVSIWGQKISDARDQRDESQSVRAKMIMEQFLGLVTEYHCSERKMSFYADKLCLTPKYLSKLIKQVSGRSGPDWIDSFVILEAKNMLKYSDLTIKQIVARLNFPNQSVFYKFFKAHTGMTPSGYRRH